MINSGCLSDTPTAEYYARGREQVRAKSGKECRQGGDEAGDLEEGGRGGREQRVEALGEGWKMSFREEDEQERTRRGKGEVKHRS